MKIIYRLGMPLLATILLASSAAYAQESTDDQAAVWAAVEAIWVAEEEADNDDIEEMLSADFMGWNTGAPTPKSKASSRMWREFGQDQGKSLQHELYPLSIVVHGDMAVAHYLYTNAVQRRDKSVEVVNGRFLQTYLSAMKGCGNLFPGTEAMTKLTISRQPRIQKRLLPV